MVTIDAAMIGSNIVTLPGDWTQDTLAVGYTYKMMVTFPTFYVQKSEEEHINLTSILLLSFTGSS